MAPWAEREGHALLAQPARQLPSGALPEPAAVGSRLVGDQGHRQIPAAQRGGDLAADEARPDDDHGVGGRGGQAGLELAQIVERAQHPDRRIIGARHGQPLGLGAGGDHAGGVGQPPAAGEHNLVPGGAQRHRPAPDQRYALLGKPFLLLDGRLGLARLTAQQLLGPRVS
jgi:hypothetical protein